MISVWPKFYIDTEHYKEFNEKGWMYNKANEDGIRDWIGQGYLYGFYDAYAEGGIDIEDPTYCNFGHSGECIQCWNREIPSAESTPGIKDSGERREFHTGAVRDIQEGKGRCDLMPLDVVANVGDCWDQWHRDVLLLIYKFQCTGCTGYLDSTLNCFGSHAFSDPQTMLLEVSKHFEEGAKKYGEHNWQKGIPINCYIDSAVRHYLKFLRGDGDEPHDRAFCWNIICAIWTCKHRPELVNIPAYETIKKEQESNDCNTCASNT